MVVIAPGQPWFVELVVGNEVVRIVNKGAFT